MRSVGDCCDSSTLLPTHSIQVDRPSQILQHQQRHQRQSTTFDFLEDLPPIRSRKKRTGTTRAPPLCTRPPTQLPRRRTRAQVLKTSWISQRRTMRARICCAKVSSPPGKMIPPGRSSTAPTRCRGRTLWLRRYGGCTARPRNNCPTRRGWRTSPGV